MTESKWREGGCFCGAVRYRVRGAAVWKMGCTCNTCVKMHAAPYVVMAGFGRGDYEILTGQPVGYRSSPRVIREFCPLCGTTLNYCKDAAGAPELAEAADLIYVAVASLDDPEVYPPDEIVHGRDKIDWMHFTDDVPVHEFVSPDAGRLQFGGIEQAGEAVPAKGGPASDGPDGT